MSPIKKCYRLARGGIVAGTVRKEPTFDLKLHSKRLLQFSSILLLLSDSRRSHVVDRSSYFSSNNNRKTIQLGKYGTKTSKRSSQIPILGVLLMLCRLKRLHRFCWRSAGFRLFLLLQTTTKNITGQILFFFIFIGRRIDATQKCRQLFFLALTYTYASKAVTASK